MLPADPVTGKRKSIRRFGLTEAEVRVHRREEGRRKARPALCESLAEIPDRALRKEAACSILAGGPLKASGQASEE